MASLTPGQTTELLQGPALAPPPGQKSNFIDPKSLGTYVVPVVATAISVDSVALLMRLYTKRCVSRRFGIEDYSAILGWAMLVGFCVACVFCSPYGAHQWNLTLERFFQLLYYSQYVQILYGPTIFCIKLSILLQYLRIFVPTRASNMPMFVAIQAILWSNLIFYTIDTFLEIFPCSPRAFIWNKLIIDGHCLNLGIAFKATGIFNVISDFTILLLPMHSIWKLHLTTKKKLGLCAISGTGLLACITSIIRLVYTFGLIASTDVSWNTILVGLWGIAEVGIGFLCVCLPSLPKFSQIVRPKIYEFSRLAYSRSKTLTLPVTSNKSSSAKPKHGTKDKDAAKWNDPFDPRTNLNGNYTELEDWERNANVEEHQVIITGQSLKESQEILEQGQIFQTMSFDVEKYPRKPEEAARQKVPW